MDFNRSCYIVTQMRFGQGPGSFTWPVRWYRTTKPFVPLPHVYGSRIWEPTGNKPWWDTGEVGEVYDADRNWADGSAPPPMACTEPRGSAEAWLGSLEGPLFPVEGFPGWGTGLGLILDGAGRFLVIPAAGGGGLVLNGGGIHVSIGTGGMVLAGAGGFPYVAGGGLALDGEGAWPLVASGGLEAGGQGVWPRIGGGGLSLAGGGVWPELGAGGLSLAGGGVWPELGAGGLALAGGGVWPELAGAGGLALGGDGVWGWDVAISGSIIDFAGISLPTGYLDCDGSSVLRATYPDLFTAIGTTWGSVDGTHFTLPDLRGCVTLSSGTGTGLTARAVADSGGEETHALITAELASHNHSLNGATLYNTAPLNVSTAAANLAVRTVAGTTTGNAGSGTAHQNMQPWKCIRKLIKT